MSTYRRIATLLTATSMMCLSGCFTAQTVVPPVSQWEPYADLPPTTARAPSSLVTDARQRIVHVALSSNVEAATILLSRCRAELVRSAADSWSDRILPGKTDRQSARQYDLAKALLESSGDSIKNTFKSARVYPGAADAVAASGPSDLVVFYDLSLGNTRCVRIAGDAHQALGIITQRVEFLTPNLEIICAYTLTIDPNDYYTPFVTYDTETWWKKIVAASSRMNQEKIASCVKSGGA